MRLLSPARCLLLSAVLAPAVAAGALGTQAAPTATLQLVGHSSLGGRGMNAALAVAGGCAYVGSRNDAAPQVLDISAPSAPRPAGTLTAHPGSTPRELRVLPAARVLVVMFYSLNGGPNQLDLYRWSSSCLAPVSVGHYSFGAASPHEFYLWQDPRAPGRVLLYVTMFGAAGEGLQVLDISDPANPSHIGGLTVPAAYGHAPVHSIALSADGRTAYVSLWTGGLVVADVADIAGARPNPAIHLLTPASGVYATAPGNVHSAVPIPGTSLVLTTDERYPSPYGAGCPFGPAHVVDVSNPARPTVVATMAVPENGRAECAAAPRNTWTSHNPTITPHLALVSWYSAGLQVFQLDDPRHPVRLTEARPAGTNPIARDLQLGNSDSMTWSYPVISGGLIYVVDINQGLLVYRYHGPHEDEVSATVFLEGNSNLSTAAATAPSPSAGGSSPGPGAAPTRPPTGTGAGNLAGAQLAITTVALAALVAAVVLFAWRRRRP